MVAVYPEKSSKAWTRPALIDCDLHNELHGDIEAILPYMSAIPEPIDGPSGSFQRI